MLATEAPLAVFDLQQAGEAQWQALNSFQNRLQAEQWPEDSPRPLTMTIAEFRDRPACLDHQMWVIWDRTGTQIRAAGSLEVFNGSHNQHLAEFWIQVLPEARRQGYARQLLRPIVAGARAANRRLLLTWTSEAVPAGATFVRGLGGQPGLDEHTNQLELTDLR
ncbi:MAG TPA: GNAT family N-acetyltransferase, partial [Chloroflexia bacterium]|nr:GNAT family N-acetyltransferase [Chloroflexia bacterium]